MPINKGDAFKGRDVYVDHPFEEVLFRWDHATKQPYILHPLRLMLKSSGENERIVAVLHDVVEDGGVSLDELAGCGFYAGPVDKPVVVVDKNGNAIPVDTGQSVNASPYGDFQQVIGTDSKPTGDRLDRGGHPNQRDPQARAPYAHRPGVTDPNGNPHLPINPPAPPVNAGG
ncbi:hypothetical protein [Dyella choica]|uniref:hypothetical protein n=1 Tax=Dyella choica TaxID=1927959 RepID=UPI001E341C09|nr:hypothetical protein [Dyella choica]